MPISRTSAFGRSRWRGRTISAASAASSIWRRAIFSCRCEGAQGLVEAEPGIVEHMNEDHADAVELYATALADASPGAWRMVGIDPEGFDIVLEGAGRRVLFAQPITTPAEARKELVRLAAEARAGRQ